MGVRSFECEFSSIDQWYNAHFHILVPDKGTANILIQEWCKHWGYRIANKSVQENSIRKIWNTEGCLKEIIKYSSKVFTDPFMKKESESKVPPVIYAASIHNRIVAMKKHRIFDRFGFNVPKCDKIIVTKSIINEYDELIFEHNNWIDEATEQPRTDYKPSFELIDILENNIDTVLE